jgi:hypothetical protein
MLTKEDIDEIKHELDERYVLKSDCNDTQRNVALKFANDDKRIDLLVSQQKINNYLTTAIAGGIIALVIKVFIGG